MELICSILGVVFVSFGVSYGLAALLGAPKRR